MKYLKGGGLMAAALFAAGLAGIAGVNAADQGAQGSEMEILVRPSETKWSEGPPSLPQGAKMSVLEGNPMEPGPFTMRLKVPAGYKIPPHRHGSPEHVTVISGTFNVGMGEKEDMTKGNELPPGSFFLMSVKTPHFAWAREETVIQLHGTGPWQIKYVNPSDDPRNK